MSYIYEDYLYKLTIPKGFNFALDDSIPWYEPLKLAEMFHAVRTQLSVDK